LNILTTENAKVSFPVNIFINTHIIFTHSVCECAETDTETETGTQRKNYI